MTLHGSIDLGDRHPIHNFEYADAAARAAAVLTSADIGKIALQLDDMTLWLVEAEGPPAVWVSVGSGATGFIKADGSVPFTNDQSMGGNNLTNLGLAVGAGDAVRLNEFQVVAGDLGIAQGDISDLETHNLLMEGDTKEPTGFTLAQRIRTSMAFDNGTRLFTLTPTAIDSAYWYQGSLRAILVPKTLTLAAAEGMHHVYLGADDALHEYVGFDPAFFTEHAAVAAIYWDGTSAKEIYFGDERHGCRMDGDTHLDLHFTIGPTISSGLALADLDVDQDGSSDDHVHIGVDAGGTFDQDMPHTIGAQAKPAQVPVYYRTGALGYWRIQDLPNPRPPLVMFGGQVGYNYWTGATWTQAGVPDGQYVCAHVFATNDASRPITAMQGIAYYADPTAAREGANNEINYVTLLAIQSIPCAEFTPIGTLIYQCSTSYANTYKARLVSTDIGEEYLDWRFSRLVSTGDVPGYHTHQSTAVRMPSTGGVSAFDTLRDWFYVAASPMVADGFAATLNAGAGTVDIQAGVVLTREGAAFNAPLVSASVPAITGLAITDNAVRFVYAFYNGGTPTIVSMTTPQERQDYVPLYMISRHGTVMDAIDLRVFGLDFPGQMNDGFANTTRFQAERGGVVVSASSGLKPKVTAGHLRLGALRFDSDAFDCNVADTFTYAYRNGGVGFTYVATQTDIDPNKYDDGSGALATLTDAYYGCHWLYEVFSKSATRLLLVYGQKAHASLAEALSEQEPSTTGLPYEARWPGPGALLAKIVVQKAATTFSIVHHPWDVFPPLPQSASGGSTSYNEVVVIEDVKAVGTQGGSSTAATWHTRVLNTLVNPEGFTWVSVVANQVILAPGKYQIEAWAPAVGAGRHKLRWRRITAVAANVLRGQSAIGAYFAEEDTSMAQIAGVFTVAAGGNITYELQHWIERGVATYGLGHKASLASGEGPDESEVYARIVLRKIGSV